MGETWEGCLEEVSSKLRLQRREELSKWGGERGREYWAQTERRGVPFSGLTIPSVVRAGSAQAVS